MTGVPRSKAEHELKVNPTFVPVVQKQRKMGPEQAKACEEQVQQLVDAGIIREIQYQTWVANPFKCFLDAYKGYHQIHIAARDQDKTAFRTNNGTYCYKMMPFGLKNAGSTYQKLMDKEFKPQIGRNLEVYMDDLVIKSKTEETMLKDIEETFQTLRSISMKLNPGKCSFGMEEGNFLGVIVTNGGFKANSENWKPCEKCHRQNRSNKCKRSTGELSGRLAKWAIELGEYAIEYKPRLAIKGQVLADFIAEIPQEKEEECKREIEAPVDQKKNEVWKMFTDRAFNDEGAGASLKITNPEGQQFTYALHLEFKSTNNEAEYEALLAGLRIARKLGARHLEAHVDSMLVANQIEGSYDAKDDKMASYLAQAKALMATFATCKVKHINRSENKQADTLNKLASVGFEHLAKDVRIEVLAMPSIMNKEIPVCSETGKTWMTPIINYLARGILPEKKADARKIRHKALNYTIQGDILYRRSYLGPLLRCVDPQDTNYLLREIHKGICGVHAAPRMVITTVLLVNFSFKDGSGAIMVDTEATEWTENV
ncbi:uncharacterized protein LOC143584238 [Bidens hawaiensis]|uniref:uncharacterized protein LOC143584238 n=1 Tax=Bidens hawaiensis TaxID=980011 RepID=UPI00404903EA